MKKSNYTFHTKENIDFILSNFDKMNNKQLADATGLDIRQVRGIYRRNGLRRIEGDGRFKPGQIPANKGMKMTPEQYKKCSKTMFKKGNTPLNHRPVGSERIDRDGYTMIKTKEPNIWKLKHRELWFEDNPPLKENEIVYFIDGDKTNVIKSNLGLKTRTQNMFENSKFNPPKEIIPSLVLMSKIKKKLKE